MNWYYPNQNTSTLSEGELIFLGRRRTFSMPTSETQLCQEGAPYAFGYRTYIPVKNLQFFFCHVIKIIGFIIRKNYKPYLQ